MAWALCGADQKKTKKLAVIYESTSIDAHHAGYESTSIDADHATDVEEKPTELDDVAWVNEMAAELVAAASAAEMRSSA